MLSVLRTNEVLLNASLEIWSCIRFWKTNSRRIFFFSFFLTKHSRKQRHMVSCQIHKNSNQQNTECQGITPRFLNSLGILNKLCAVFACPFHYTVMCCLLHFKRAVNSVTHRKQRWKYYRFLFFFVFLQGWCQTSEIILFPSKFPYCKIVVFFMRCISFTSRWQGKTVKIDTVIKGTSGTGEKKKNSSAVGESGSAVHVCLKAK